MRASTIIFALAVFASACGAPPQDDQTATASVQLEANKSIVVQLNDAQNAWDYETIGSLMAPDVRRHCQATPDSPVNSREDYITLLKAWESVIPDAHQKINRIIAEDKMVAVHVTLTGTQTGPMGNIPPTGKQFVSDALAMFRIEDGKIAEVWVEWDNVAILSQLGVFPPPESKS